ncbi:hypothetical protein [Endozoicomonas lisbonensis]|uniref:Uncharacterized protein n=1 Tax=Endozoicomonas lisbonensis TaxID=3120522 RepID=A0ABV2SJW6_9GAMM
MLKEITLLFFIILNSLFSSAYANELPAHFQYLAEGIDRDEYERVYGQKHGIVNTGNQRQYHRYADNIEKQLSAICSAYKRLGRGCESGVAEQHFALLSWISVLPESQTSGSGKWVSLYSLQTLDNSGTVVSEAVQFEDIYQADALSLPKEWRSSLPDFLSRDDYDRPEDRFCGEFCAERDSWLLEEKKSRFKAANKARASENRLQLHYALEGLDAEAVKQIQHQLSQIFPESAVHDLDPSKAYTLLLQAAEPFTYWSDLPKCGSFFTLDSNGHFVRTTQKSDEALESTGCLDEENSRHAESVNQKRINYMKTQLVRGSFLVETLIVSLVFLYKARPQAQFILPF